jgi:hypothetical protein
MKVAWCLHGQPRDILSGYATIKAFMDKHPEVQFEFFCHTWFSSDPAYKYSVSSYRNLQPIPQEAHSIATIDKLYTPIQHCVEEPIDFDVSDILQSKAVLNIPNKNIHNIKTARSNIYSQTKVRDILYEYVNRTSIQYDFVISSRYDIHVSIPLVLNTLDVTMIYGANMHSPRKILIDHLYVMPMHIFFDVCSIYHILHKIIDNSEIEQQLQVSGERFSFITETLITCALYYFNYIDNLVLTPMIPNFI